MAWKPFFVSHVCPECGEPREAFKLITSRWNKSKVKFWNPRTWSAGYWEDKE